MAEISVVVHGGCTFGELVNDLRAERGEVAGVAAGHQPLVAHDLLIDHQQELRIEAARFGNLVRVNHPQEHFRAYLDDGPRAGETVSLAPADGATTTYRLADPDMRTGLWVYRVVRDEDGASRTDRPGV